MAPGVDGGEDQVAGDSCGHGDLRRLPVPDLPHHDDVRVLPQNRPEGRRKGEAGPGVHLDLVGAGQSILHRILQRHQVPALPIQLCQGREEGAALSASGGSRRQNDPLASRHEVPKTAQVVVREAQGIQAPGSFGGIQDPDDGLLPLLGREGGDPETKLPLPLLQGKAPVLGFPFDGNVHPGHDLQAGYDGLVAFGGEAHDPAEDAVQAVPDADLPPLPLDVDVRSFLLHALVQDVVHQPDDGAGVGGPLQGTELVVSSRGCLPPLLGEFLHQFMEFSPISPGNTLQNGSGRGYHRFHPASTLELDVVQNPQVQRVCHGQPEGSVVGRKRKDPATLGQFRQDHPEGGFVGGEGRGLVGKAELVGEGLGHGLLVGCPPLDQKGPQPLSRTHLALQGPLQLLLRHGAGLQKQLAQDLGAWLHHEMQRPPGAMGALGP